MSRKLKSYGLFIVLLILLSILAYLLKNLKTDNAKVSSSNSLSALHDAQYYNELGNSLMRKEDFSGSVDAFNKSIELSKNTKYFYVAYTGRAHTKFNMNDCDGTIEDAKMALSGDSKIWDMYTLAGICEFEKRNFKDSIQYLTTAISLIDKNNKDSWRNYAYRAASEISINDIENAKKDLYIALKLNNNSFFIYECLYRLYMNNNIKDYKIAAEYFEKRMQYPEGIDYTFFEDGSLIYMGLYDLEKQGGNPVKMEQYRKLALKNANKAYVLKPSAETAYSLCLTKASLEEKDAMQTCREALTRAGQEKNDKIYKDAYELVH
ncbi:MAG: hypothetical protein V4591_04215 [Bdellovibrionota bacterium]